MFCLRIILFLLVYRSSCLPFKEHFYVRLERVWYRFVLGWAALTFWIALFFEIKKWIWFASRIKHFCDITFLLSCVVVVAKLCSLGHTSFESDYVSRQLNTFCHNSTGVTDFSAITNSYRSFESMEYDLVSVLNQANQTRSTICFNLKAEWG